MSEGEESWEHSSTELTEVAEYRNHVRTKLTDETIFLISNPKGRVYGLGVITDISGGGLGMLSGFSHVIGETLIFEGLEGCSGAKSAYIRWAINDSTADMFNVGLEFA
jgi:hypothetical protein